MDGGLSSNFLSSSRQRFLESGSYSFGAFSRFTECSENSLNESFEFNDFLTFARSDITAKRESAAKNAVNAFCRLPDDDSDFDEYLDAVADFFSDDEVVQVAILDQIKDVFKELKKITEPYEKACERIPSLILQCFGISKKVQNLAIQAVTSLIDEELLTREAVQNFIVPFLFDFVFDADTIPCADGFNDRWSDRVHIVALLSKIATSVEQNLYSKRWVFEEFVPRYSGLFTDQNFVIRKLSIAALGIFARYFGQKFTEKCLIPHLEQAVADENFRVRKLCCEVFVDIAKNSSAEVRAHVLTPRFLALLQDPNKNVYHAAVQQLGPFIATFADPRRTGIEFREGRLVHVHAESPLETDENDVDDEGKPKDVPESEAVDKVIMDDSSPSSSSSGGSPAQEAADSDEDSVYDVPQGFMLPGDAARQPTVSPPSSAGTSGPAAASPGDLNAALEGLLEHYDGESALDASFVAEDDDDEKADDGDEYFLDEEGPAAGDIFASSPSLHLNFDEDEVDVEVLSSSFGVNGQTSWVPYSDHDTEDPHSAREHLLTKLELTDEKEETAPHDPDPDNDFPGFTSDELEMSELDLTIREEDQTADEDRMDDSGDEPREPEPTAANNGQPSTSNEGMHEAANKSTNPTLELFESLEREIHAEQEGGDQQNTATEISSEIPSASEKTNSKEFEADSAALLQRQGSPTKDLFDALDAMMQNEKKSDGYAFESPSSPKQVQSGESEGFTAQIQGIHESVEETDTSSSSEYTSAASSTSKTSTTSTSSSSSSYWSFDSLFDVEPDELEAYEKRSAKNVVTVKDADVVQPEVATTVATEKPSVSVPVDHSSGEKERMTYSEAVSSSLKESVCVDEGSDEADRQNEPLLPRDERSNVDDKTVEAEAPEAMEVAVLDAYEQALLNSPPKALQTLEAAGFWQKRIDFFCKSTKQLVKKTVDAAAAAATSSSPFRGTGMLTCR
ncbi:Protein PPFR-1 c [Aphelenchoides avenae]|nr:Protein PPFR-1 c [Aphelenchus avenae]